MLRILKLSALVSGVLLLNAVTTLLFVQSRVPAAAQLGAPCVEGDVNGDAGLDIGDPVFLLQHLFQGGPGPVACAQPGNLTINDVEQALEALVPSEDAQVRLWVQTPGGPLQTVTDVYTVPPGKRLIVTWLHRAEPNEFLGLGGEFLDPPNAVRPQAVWWTYNEGEVVQVFEAGGSATWVSIRGYLVDQSPTASLLSQAMERHVPLLSSYSSGLITVPPLSTVPILEVPFGEYSYVVDWIAGDIALSELIVPGTPNLPLAGYSYLPLELQPGTTASMYNSINQTVKISFVYHKLRL